MVCVPSRGHWPRFERTELENALVSSCLMIEASRLALRWPVPTAFLSDSGLLSEELGVDEGVTDLKELVFDGVRASSFFFRNCSLRLAFLLCVEGLGFFRVTGSKAWPPLVSKEKLKVDPILREKLKAFPWPASAWQKAKHWDTRGVSSPHSVAAVIFTFSSELRNVM